MAHKKKEHEVIMQQSGSAIVHFLGRYVEIIDAEMKKKLRVEAVQVTKKKRKSSSSTARPTKAVSTRGSSVKKERKPPTRTSSKKKNTRDPDGGYGSYDEYAEFPFESNSE